MKHVDDLFRVGGGFFLIAGPCVLETWGVHSAIAEVLRQVGQELGIPVIFKGSFDKANRASFASPRGPGVQQGLEQLFLIKQRFALPVLTDIHQPEQAAPVVEVCDVLQIPAALCRQTDLLAAAATTGRPTNLKKGQWVGPQDMLGAVEKMDKVADLDYPVAVTERGTFFGYGDLVVDMRNLVKLRDVCATPVIFDATHAVQRPGAGPQGSSAGDREYIAPLARAAVAAGADALYLEVHPEPDKAPSDGACMLPLSQLLPLMRQVMVMRKAVHG